MGHFRPPEAPGPAAGRPPTSVAACPRYSPRRATDACADTPTDPAKVPPDATAASRAAQASQGAQAGHTQKRAGLPPFLPTTYTLARAPRRRAHAP